MYVSLFYQYLSPLTRTGLYVKKPAKLLLFFELTKFFRIFFAFDCIFSQKPPLERLMISDFAMFRRVLRNNGREHEALLGVAFWCTV